ncbi:hypothetical protein ACJX0J_009083, partial [Zea mays]
RYQSLTLYSTYLQIDIDTKQYFLREVQIIVATCLVDKLALRTENKKGIDKDEQITAAAIIYRDKKFFIFYNKKALVVVLFYRPRIDLIFLFRFICFEEYYLERLDMIFTLLNTQSSVYRKRDFVTPQFRSSLDSNFSILPNCCFIVCMLKYKVINFHGINMIHAYIGRENYLRTLGSLDLQHILEVKAQ